MPFETYFDEMASMAFAGAPDFNVIFYELNANNFVMFADYQSSFGGRALSEAVYNGASLSAILDYFALSKEMEGSANLKDYLQSTFSMNGKVSADDVESIKTELNAYKTRTSAIDRMKKFTNSNSFNALTLISNTTADIDFDDYAAEYTPAGATPLICYVGDFLGRDMESKTNPYFNTGYFQKYQVIVCYQSNNGNLLIEEKYIVVPWYTNSNTESLYNSGLGELNKTYKIIDESSIVIEDPIISEWLLPSA